jgi:hypothetical protein
MAQSGDVTVLHVRLGRSGQVWYGVRGNVLREPSDGQRSAGVQRHHRARWRPWHAREENVTHSLDFSGNALSPSQLP